MQQTGLNKTALLKACECSLISKQFDKAFDLLEALKESGFPIRQHYFWPFFAGSVTEKGNTHKVFDTHKVSDYFPYYILTSGNSFPLY